ncbi:MAG: cupin domain-containing protein [Pseudomonadota bacterium]
MGDTNTITINPDDGVALVKPGQNYVGGQGFTYGAGASRETVQARNICMNVLPMPAGARANVHYHDRIETIAYLLEGTCDVFHGARLQHRLAAKAGDHVFIPADVPHAPCNLSGKPCTWLVVHAAGSDQEGLVLLPELDKVIADL